MMDEQETVAAKESSVAYHRINENPEPYEDGVVCGRLHLRECELLTWKEAEKKGLKPCGHCYDRAYDLKFKEETHDA